MPVFLVMIVLWCIAVGISQVTPVQMATLGSASYIFFVPLIYIGADLMADEERAFKALRIVALAGGLVGAGAILSALLGAHSPALLQPIIPSVGIHTFHAGNIYLAPSIFATAEEASEQLLVSLFAWVALAYLPHNRMGRFSSSLLLVLMVGGLFAAERRTDIDVAILGLIGVLALNGVAGRAARARPASQLQFKRRGQVGIAILLAALGSIALLSILGADRLISFLTSESPWQRISLMFSPTNTQGMAGQGPGTSTQGAELIGATSFSATNSSGPYVAYSTSGRIFMTAEGGLTKTWLELGIVGVMLYAGVFTSILGPMLRSVRVLDGAGRALLVLTIALGVIFLKGHQSLDNPLVQPMYWLAAGGVWGRLRASQAKQHPRLEGEHLFLPSTIVRQNQKSYHSK
jgi:hypothetical protein